MANIWKQFDDWLINTPSGSWPSIFHPHPIHEPYFDGCSEIIARNAALLLDRKAWNARVEAFNRAIQSLPAAQRDGMKSKYSIRFDSHNFAGGALSFKNIIFPCAVSFRNCKFGDGFFLSFNGTEFSNGPASFERVKFGNGIVSFEKAKFSGVKVSFDFAKFSQGKVSFEKSDFSGSSLSFIRTNFGCGYFNFQNVVGNFCEIKFDDAIFEDGNISFKSADFTDSAIHFPRVKFGDGKVSFNYVKFGSKNLDFSNCTFGNGSVWFQYVEFGNNDVTFDGAKFGKGNLSFRGAKIKSGDLTFNNTTFAQGRIAFVKLKLEGGNFIFRPENLNETHLDVTDSIINGSLYIKAKQLATAKFSRLEVSGSSDFSGTKFIIVPDFRDAKFGRPPGVANMVVPEPKLQKKYFWIFVKCNDAEAVIKYRKLKAMALATNDHEKDGDFFAFEMLAKRGVETVSGVGLLFNTFYWQLSYFGQSFTRPVKWIIASFVVYFLLYNLIIGNLLEPSTRWVFSAKLSFLNIIPFLGTLFKLAAAPSDHISNFQKTYNLLYASGGDVFWMQLISVSQNLFGSILIFLFLLALRNKFRLK